VPRVTNQKTRQYILVTGDPLDLDGPLPDKVQLFSEGGNPLMIGVGSNRAEFEHETSSIASGAYETDEIEWAPAVRVFKIATDVPARVRIYATAAQRDADVSRQTGTKPIGNHGRLFEFVTTATILEWTLTPVVDMTADQADGIFYITVTNLSNSTDTVAVTFHYNRTE
jgi:hypothetical protein